jgi:CRP-like cAMP-binding protein
MSPADPAFLESLDPHVRAALERSGTRRRYPPRTALFHEAQQADRLYVILKGRVKLTRTSEEGREVVLAIRGRGDLIGELAAIDGHPRSATALALEPVEVLTIGAPEFLAQIEAHPQIAVALVKMIARRLRDADTKRVEFAAHDAMARVAARIVELAERYGVDCDAGTAIDLPISQEELAGWVGCSREAVSRALQSMRELGWVGTERRRITVIDLEALQARAA